MSSGRLVEVQTQWVWPVSQVRTGLAPSLILIFLFSILFITYATCCLSWTHPIIAVMITDLEYPYRPAFSLLTKLLDEHASLLAVLPAPSAAPSFGTASANAFGGNPSQAAAGGLPPAQKGKVEATLTQYLSKYQDPKQADTIMKVQKELDETKIVLVSADIEGQWVRAR
jgi:hypothetical protein